MDDVALQDLTPFCSNIGDITALRRCRLFLVMCKRNIMRQDIVKKIKQDFENSEEVVKILESMESMNRGPISDRVYRGIIFLAQGNMSKLNHFIELSFKDYRDLIWQAEYEDPEVQKYDFNKSFSELGLL